VGKVQTVDIQSTRPLHTSRLFIGKTPEQTLALLPLLFNVCGVAQAFASFTACSQALAISENPEATLARQILLAVEIVREHCWWLLINRDKAQLAPFLHLVQPVKHALFAQGNAFSLTSQLQVNHEQLNQLIDQLEQALNKLFAGQRLSWLAVQNDDDLQRWLIANTSIPALLLNDLLVNQYHSLGRTTLSLLPTLDERDLHSHLSQQNAAEFSRCPSWHDERYETSCLNRQQYQPLIAYLLARYGNGLLTRLASRLMELATMPELLLQMIETGRWSVHSGIPTLERGNDEMTASPLKDWQSSINNTGLAQIQASRGLLIHSVTLQNAIIADYHIIAPTEWNFQPNGIAAMSLQQLRATNKTLLQQQAAKIINAIDPCVGFELMINEE
jgi:Ni,Fe-hydrogenase I large subunit